MKTQTNILLLIGSPKTMSTSAALGSHLLGLLHRDGATSSTMHVTQALKHPQGMAALCEAAGHADIIILAFPLYVDSLPSPVVRFLETYAAERAASDSNRPQRLLAISNCGFPEPHHNDTALTQCRLFCSSTGIGWVGGLGLGGGGMIDGRPLAERGRAVRNVLGALQLAAQALLDGTKLPDEAVALISRPLIPVWLYLLFGSTGWKRRAKRYGALERIGARPYQAA